jgi:hypothetical protein
MGAIARCLHHTAGCARPSPCSQPELGLLKYPLGLLQCRLEMLLNWSEAQKLSYLGPYGPPSPSSGAVIKATERSDTPKATMWPFSSLAINLRRKLEARELRSDAPRSSTGAEETTSLFAKHSELRVILDLFQAQNQSRLLDGPLLIDPETSPHR